MDRFDLIVIGAGPAGRAAALQGRRLGATVALVEMASHAAGTGAVRGIIPARTLRETARQHHRAGSDSSVFTDDSDVELASLMAHVEAVAAGHADTIARRLERAGVELVRGRARLRGPDRVDVRSLSGDVRELTTERVIVCTGARPREVPEAPVDHEHVLDVDSILSMIYLPRSLMVLGSGTAALEYATVFASLGVQVTVLDPGDAPLPQMEREQNQELLRSFERRGCRYVPRAEVLAASWDGLDVVARLAGGQECRARKALVCAGVEPVLRGVSARRLGVDLDERGFVVVDGDQRTSAPGIFAAGDVTGPPHLASAATAAGQRAASCALGEGVGAHTVPVPEAVYTVPELASVGMGEAEARETFGAVRVGVADYSDVARARICSERRGSLKLVCDPDCERILGVHLVGEGATELVAIGQVLLGAGLGPAAVIDHCFPFPSYAEAYRLAALDALGRKRDAAVRPASVFGQLLAS